MLLRWALSICHFGCTPISPSSLHPQRYIEMFLKQSSRSPSHGNRVKRKAWPLLWLGFWYLFKSFEPLWSLGLLGLIWGISFGFSKSATLDLQQLLELLHRHEVKNLRETRAFWKCVTLFNAICWGATYICTKAGIDALVEAQVPQAAAVFQFIRAWATSWFVMRFMQGFGQITVGMIRYKPGCTRYLFMYYIYIYT